MEFFDYYGGVYIKWVSFCFLNDWYILFKLNVISKKSVLFWLAFIFILNRIFLHIL